MALVRVGNFKIEGLADLDKALQELPKATARNVLLRVLLARAEPVREMGEALAPRSAKPRHRAHMAETYSVSTKLSRSQKRKFPKESAVEVYVGPSPSKRSIQTEFGNAHMSARPHLRPAWDSTNSGVLEGITQDLADEIEKARARLARKAEREAAKMKAL